MKLALLPAIAGVLVTCPALSQTRSASPPLRTVKSAIRSATVEPAASGFVRGTQVYPWSEGAIFTGYAAPGLVTDIVLQPGESLVAVASGDTARWVIGDTTSGSGETQQTHVLVKPFSAGLKTNLVITTDRRTYHVRLVSTAGTALSSIRWTYPQDELLALQRKAAIAQAAAPIVSGVTVEQLHFNYEISGDKPAWRPLRAFRNQHSVPHYFWEGRHRRWKVKELSFDKPLRNKLFWKALESSGIVSCRLRLRQDTMRKRPYSATFR